MIKIKEKSDLIDWQFHVGTNVIVSKNTMVVLFCQVNLIKKKNNKP